MRCQHVSGYRRAGSETRLQQENAGAGGESERDPCAAGRATKRQGMEASPRSASSGEGEVEWGGGVRVTLPPPSDPCMTPSPYRDVVPLQTRSSAGERGPKQPQAEGGMPTGSSKQLLPVQVTSDHEGEEDPSVCTSAKEVGLTPRPEVQHVLEIPVTAVVTSSSSFGEPRPPPKKVCTKGSLLSSTRYAHVGCYTLFM
jgi:hypothetical protein